MDIESSSHMMAGVLALDTGVARGCRPKMPPYPRRQPEVIRKWPASFWVILKVLGLFHHRALIGSRKCYLCKVGSRVARLDLLRESDPECGCTETGVDINLDHLILAYESDSGDKGIESPAIAHGTQSGDRSCEACAAQWWNSYGVPVIYTEEDIGVTHWNHRGSILLSFTILLIEMCILSFNAGHPLYSFWGRSDQILQLMIKLSLVCLISLYPILACLARIRSSLRNGTANKFAWATVLNVRYLIKRGQFLNLSRKGLPGKPFLLLCLVLSPLAEGYRSFIFLHLGSCGVTVYTLLTSLVGVILMETWSLFVYILYFVRVSFERQLNLHLAHVRKKGEARERRAALFATAADFSCYKQLVDMFTALLFPCLVFAIVANISFDYILGVARNDTIEQTANFAAEFNFAILAWIEIGSALVLYILALGGLQVGYIWDNFLLNLLHFKGEGECADLWKGLFQDLKHFDKSSKLLLTTIICSVVGIYAGIGVIDQTLFDPVVSCDAAYINSTVVGLPQ